MAAVTIGGSQIQLGGFAREKERVREREREGQRERGRGRESAEEGTISGTSKSRGSRGDTQADEGGAESGAGEESLTEVGSSPTRWTSCLTTTGGEGGPSPAQVRTRGTSHTRTPPWKTLISESGRGRNWQRRQRWLSSAASL